MKFLANILFFSMIAICHGENDPLLAVCLAYNGKLSDKPIGNLIFSSKKAESESLKKEILKGKSLANEKFYIELMISSEELKSFDDKAASIKGHGEGDFVVFFRRVGGVESRVFSVKEGLNLAKDLLGIVKSKSNKETIQKAFVNRLKGIVGD